MEVSRFVQTIATLWEEHTTGPVFSQYASFFFQFLPISALRVVCTYQIRIRFPRGGETFRTQDPGRKGRGQAEGSRKAGGSEAALPQGEKKDHKI